MRLMQREAETKRVSPRGNLIPVKPDLLTPRGEKEERALLVPGAADNASRQL